MAAAEAARAFLFVLLISLASICSSSSTPRKTARVYELKKGDFSMKLTNWGATILSVILPDSKGHLADVALGYEGIGPYINGTTNFGALIGRVANRVSGARFVLNGTAHRLYPNDGKNSIHGGHRGFSRVFWTVKEKVDGEFPYITFYYYSFDGEQVMESKMVGIALSNSSRDTLLQLTDDMRGFKPDFLGPVLEAQVNCGAAFRCCAHTWTPTHDKLLLKGHDYFIRKFHDDSKKFLLPNGWKKIQEKFKLMDQHVVGLHDLQSRFFAIKRGVTTLPKITFYRLWGDKEVDVLRKLFNEIMSVEKSSGKKIFLDPAEYTDIQQSLWYYLDCCPEMNQVERKLLEIVGRK